MQQRFFLFSLLSLAATASAQTAFDNDRATTLALIPPGILSVGFPGPPVLAIPRPALNSRRCVLDFTGFDADVLVRTGPGAFAVHTPAGALGLTPHENLNALEATPCGPAPATAFLYNGTGVCLDTLFATTVVVGTPWTATLSPQATRGPGSWVLPLRSSSAAGPILDLGTFFGLPPAGLSELLVGAGFITNFTPPAHGGGGTTATFSAPVPLSCGLVGAPWFAQAVVLGDLPAGAGILDPWFSSAAEGIIGTFRSSSGGSPYPPREAILRRSASVFAAGALLFLPGGTVRSARLRPHRSYGIVRILPYGPEGS